MSLRVRLLAAALLAVPALGAAPAMDFPLGKNSQDQACRAQARFSGPRGARMVDVYCGAWERPSGAVTVLPAARRAELMTRIETECTGTTTDLSAPGLTGLRQIACPSSTGGVGRYALVAERGGQVAAGSAYPADWAALVRAASVLLGASRATASESGDVSGLREIAAVFPDGPPDQGAAVNYELLRRRAYEKNTTFVFGGAERDYGELLRVHRQVAPYDLAGEAEILAEVGLNQSDARRFEDADDVLREAEAKAAQAKDAMLASKILNYRAIDQLNQRRYAQALTLATLANAARTSLMREQQTAAGVRISASQAQRSWLRAGPSARDLLVNAGQTPAPERAAVLSAQGHYVAGVSQRALNQPQAAQSLDQAASLLASVRYPPSWLTSQVAGERARLRLAAGDPGGAIATADGGLAIIRASNPNTRGEAHLLLTRARAERAAGRIPAALESGRAAIRILEVQRETPGAPPDVLSAHLDTLLAALGDGNDQQLAGEYLEAMALVWDGAAGRSASQLAARLAAREAANEARNYQDAERGYRAALARRQRLSSMGDAGDSVIGASDEKIEEARTALVNAEDALRSRSPRFLELLSPRIKAADLQSTLRDDEAYLRIVLGGAAGYGVLVTKAGIRPYRIALTEAQAETTAAKLRRSTQLRGSRLPDYDLKSAGELYAAVLGPVADQLGEVRRLHIDAGGSLAAVAFAALVETAPDEATAARIADAQDYTGVAWFGRRLAIAKAVGPASFIGLRKLGEPEGAIQLAAFGDFRPEPRRVAERLARTRGLTERCAADVRAALARLPALPETEGEATQAAGLFGGSGVARTGVTFNDTTFFESDEVANADVLLLATHGVLGLSSCFPEPALLTSLGESGDGLIEASELLDRRLAARLVILSACDTAGGARLDTARTGLSDGGEALSGLARGFLYAGATSVMATQWKVDAASSSAQTRELLALALNANAPLADALAATQKSLYDVAETAHPFYWAAFVLIGDGGAGLTRAAPPTQRPSDAVASAAASASSS